MAAPTPKTVDWDATHDILFLAHSQLMLMLQVWVPSSESNFCGALRMFPLMRWEALSASSVFLTFVSELEPWWNFPQHPTVPSTLPTPPSSTQLETERACVIRLYFSATGHCIFLELQEGDSLLPTLSFLCWVQMLTFLFTLVRSQPVWADDS